MIRAGSHRRVTYGSSVSTSTLAVATRTATGAGVQLCNTASTLTTAEANGGGFCRAAVGTLGPPPSAPESDFTGEMDAGFRDSVRIGALDPGGVALDCKAVEMFGAF